MILFTSSWCGACRNVKQTLNSKSIAYETIDVDEPEGMELAAEYSIRSLPSALIDDKIVSGAQNILKAI